MIGTETICPREQCTACGACANVCGHDAIAMHEDELGYWYPAIDVSRCVDCGLCKAVCPALHPLELHQPDKVYAAVCRDVQERASSSSGGAASMLGRYVLELGGVVYGCRQTNCRDIRHVRVTEQAGLDELKGSKYVQSDVGLCYRSVKRDLQDGRRVLFVGTPCQVAGLKRFLRREHEGLWTVDLVCHGVSPQKILQADIDLFASGEKMPEKERLYVDFRWKAGYGIRYGIRYRELPEKRLLKSISYPYDPYITAFMTGLSSRENCHRCVYAGSPRVGDLTIGDFWGLGALEKTAMNAKKGVSLLLVNTAKGGDLLSRAGGGFVLEERTLAEAVRGNANLQRASVRPRNKDVFKQILKEKGLEAACRAAIPLSRYVRLAVVEELKRVAPLVALFKRVRLLVNQCKQS